LPKKGVISLGNPVSGPEVSEGVAWYPSDEVIARSNLARFMNQHGLRTHEELLQRSTRDIEWFWDAVVKDLGIEWFKPYQQVLDTSRGIMWPRWFTGARMNITHNCIDKYVNSPKRNQVACIWEGEDGAVRKLTYRDLHVETNRLAHALRSLGVGKGDAVGIFMPMIPETVVATLACSKVGAIYTPIFSGYGPEAVATRLQDCNARVLITADGFLRRGKPVEMKKIADQAAALSPSIARLIVFKRLGIEVPWNPDRDLWWADAVSGQPGVCESEWMDPEDPFLIIYTSGTTGKPKGTVHVHCGFPIKAAQDLSHCFDLKEQDIIFWLTDLGWMMGPWLILGTLLLGSTMLLYEGSPDYPEPDRLWRIAEDHGVTILGISPTVVRSLMRYGEEWVTKRDLSSLRVLGSTGEPWNPGPWRWFFEKVGGQRCPIINYSGGTEVAGGIIGCFVTRPLKPCSFAGPVPGMAVDVVDDRGQPVREEVGELVVKAPWVGMTRGFWKDPGRYLETYWSRWPEVWDHRDWCYIDGDGFWYILGRSDDTIKVAGKRLGPAEVESALVAHPAVSEAAAIGVPHEVKGETVVCFAVLNPNYTPSDELREELKTHLEEQMGKALRPEDVKFVRELPKTRNGKIMRKVIRARYLGQNPGDLSSLENPSALQEIERLR